MKVQIKEIRVDKSKLATSRARLDFGDLQRLAQSIKDHGLLHPLVVDKNGDGKKYVLICGERRLRASVLAGFADVEVKLLEDTTELERKAMELEENVIRKDLSWIEEINCLDQLHKLRQEQHGRATHSPGNVGWGARQTAETVGRSLGSVGGDLKLAQNLKEHPELLKRVRRLPKAAARRMVEQSIEAIELRKHVEQKHIEIGIELLKGDCLELIDGLDDESVDCLITDPPFASPGIVNVGITKTASFALTESNVSTLEIMIPLYEKLMPKLAKKLKRGAHVYIFCGMGECYCQLMRILAENGFLIDDLPIIWYKERTSCLPKDYHYVSSYEAILFGHNQERKRALWKPVGNLFSIPAIAPQSRVHPLQKPHDLMRKIIENSTSVGEMILDCFAGSGSTLEAASVLQRKAVGFELDDGNYLRALEWLSVNTTKNTKT